MSLVQIESSCIVLVLCLYLTTNNSSSVDPNLLRNITEIAHVYAIQILSMITFISSLPLE